MAEKLLVRFWMDAYRNHQKSLEAGVPVFDTVPWCEIRVPGERDTVAGPVHKMDPDPRVRFAAAWAAFKANESSEGMTGTPLKMVPWLERGEVETLHHAGIRSLENLAAVTDGTITGIPGGLALRAKAAAMLKAAKEEAPVQQMTEELAKRDAEIASLKAQMAEILGAGIATATGVAPPKRRGRPPKSSYTIPTE